MITRDDESQRPLTAPGGCLARKANSPSSSAEPARRLTGDPFYAVGVLGGLVHELAINPGDVKDRLRAVFVVPPPVFKSDLPEFLHSDYDWIWDKLLGKENPAYRHRVNAALHGMHLKTAAKIASRLYDLWYQLHNYCYECEHRNLEEEEKDTDSLDEPEKEAPFSRWLRGDACPPFSSSSTNGEDHPPGDINETESLRQSDQPLGSEG